MYPRAKKESVQETSYMQDRLHATQRAENHKHIKSETITVTFCSPDIKTGNRKINRVDILFPE